MTLSFINDGEPITGTTADDFIFPRFPEGGNAVGGGGGDDLVLGDAPPVFEWQGALLNGSLADARSLDDPNYWFASGTPYNNVPFFGSGPTLCALVEASAGESEWFKVTLAGDGYVSVDVDFGVGPIGVSAATKIELYRADGSLITTSDMPFNPEVDSAIDAQDGDPHLQAYVGTASEVYIRVRPAVGDVFAGGETFLLNVYAAHAANATITYGDDRLNGGAGDDTLYGGGGSNVLYGGAGDDTLWAGDNAGARQLVHGGSGNDTIWTGASYPGHHYGDAGDDRFAISGGPGTQVDDGGTGSDTIDATYYQDGTALRIDMTTGITSLPNLTLRNFENFIGPLYDNHPCVVTGTDGANSLRGGSKGDTLDGRGGDDVIEGGAVMIGGTGTDTVSYQHSETSVIVLLALGYAISGGGNGAGLEDGSFSGFENAEGSMQNDGLVGDDGANTLTGDAGDDHLTGAGGNDRLLGGDGWDTLAGGLGDDLLNGGADQDTATYAGTTSGVTVSLPLTSAQATGGAGSDTLIGIENLIGTDFADRLTGSTAANKLDGGEGGDVLSGAGGKDQVTGGGGADRFVFGAADRGGALARATTILDFSQREHDRIDLSAIDADTGRAGTQAFTFAGRGAFTHTAGELRYVFDDDTTVIRGDTDGDAKPDLTIVLTGRVTLTAADLQLASNVFPAHAEALSAWLHGEPHPALHAYLTHIVCLV